MAKTEFPKKFPRNKGSKDIEENEENEEFQTIKIEKDQSENHVKIFIHNPSNFSMSTLKPLTLAI